MRAASFVTRTAEGRFWKIAADHGKYLEIETLKTGLRQIIEKRAYNDRQSYPTYIMTYKKEDWEKETQKRCKDCAVWTDDERELLTHTEVTLECPKHGVYVNGMCFCKQGEWD